MHQHWRQRYLVGMADPVMRPKRRGIRWQQLRANAALVAEWLQILWREGWLGSARRNREKPVTVDGVKGRQKLLDYRRKLDLHLPYGPAWDAICNQRADTRRRRSRLAAGP